MSAPELPCAVSQAGAWPVRARPPGGVPIELCDAYPRFKAAVNVAPGSEPAWGDVILKAAPLLALDSKDLGVAGELGAALWMDRRFEGLHDALTIWLDLLSDPIWPHTWPRANAERAAQLRRFLVRVETSLGEPARRSLRPGERAALEGVVETLRRLEPELSRQLGGAACTDELRKLRRALVDLSGSSPARAQPQAPAGASAVQLTDQLLSARSELVEGLGGPASLDAAEPWWVALQRPLWQVLRATVGAWPQLAPAWRLARALAWGLEAPPQGARGLLQVDPRVAQDLAVSVGRLTQASGSASWFELEALWQERGHILWLDPHRVAAERLRRAELEGPARSVERMTAGWLERAKGLADLRCDDEARTRLADDSTRRWAARLTSPGAQGPPRPSAPTPTFSAVALTQCAEKLQKEVRSALALSGSPPGASPPDILTALGALKAPVEALVQLLASLDPVSPVTANLLLTWPTLLGAVGALARGEPAPGSAPLPPPEEDLLGELAQAELSPPERLEVLWSALARQPWWLDLYRLLVEVLPLAGGDAAAVVAADCAEELTLTWPALVTAGFSSGQPLADAATRAWLAGLSARSEAARQVVVAEAPSRATPAAPAHTGSPSALGPPLAGAQATGAQATGAQATGSQLLGTEPGPEDGDPWAPGLLRIASGQVYEGLRSLEQVAQRCPGGRHRFEGALRIAEALGGVGEHAAASALLCALDGAATQHDLDRWEPALAQAVTRARCRLQAEAGAPPDPGLPHPTSSALLVRAASQGLYGLLVPPDEP